jgi:hypothetical protein
MNSKHKSEEPGDTDWLYSKTGSMPNWILFLNKHTWTFTAAQLISKLLPSRIHSVEEVDKVQNFILRRSTKWHAYRNYHDWFAFFLDNRLEIFN